MFACAVLQLGGNAGTGQQTANRAGAAAQDTYNQGAQAGREAYDSTARNAQQAKQTAAGNAQGVAAQAQGILIEAPQLSLRLCGILSSSVCQYCTKHYITCQ